MYIPVTRIQFIYLMHKFKTAVKDKMQSDFRAIYSTVFNTTKKQFLDEIEDTEFRELVRMELPSIVSRNIWKIE